MSTPVNWGNILTEIQMETGELNYMVNQIKTMPTDGLMVEWGCGGSTCKWIETLTGSQRLITIEHTESWSSRVQRAIKREFGDVSSKFEMLHIPVLYDFDHKYSTVVEEHPTGTDNYINPSDKIWDADIFFIDGIARATCALMVLQKHTKKNPSIFIHDYVGREQWYSWSTQFFRVETFQTETDKSTLCKLHLKPQ